MPGQKFAFEYWNSVPKIKSTKVLKALRNQDPFKNMNGSSKTDFLKHWSTNSKVQNLPNKSKALDLLPSIIQ